MKKLIILIIVVAILAFISGTVFGAWYNVEDITNFVYDATTKTIRIVGQ